MSASVSGAARVGTGAQSVLAQGVTSVFGFRLRGTAKLHQSRKFLLSATARVEPLEEVRAMGLDPSAITHHRPAGA